MDMQPKAYIYSHPHSPHFSVYRARQKMGEEGREGERQKILASKEMKK